MRNAIALSDEHTGVKLESIDCDYTCLAPIAIRASESYRATARREGVGVRATAARSLVTSNGTLHISGR
jgi:hypothetical protein